MANETDWNRFPVEPLTGRIFIKRAAIHADLLLAASGRAGGALLEIGVGSGAQSALLSRFFRTVTVDNDERILHTALPNLRRFGRQTTVVAANGFRLPFGDGAFGVGISQGLMEHFADLQIGELIREQLRVCRSVVFSVPSDRYPHRIVGDERFLPPQTWEEIVGQAVDLRKYAVQARYYRMDLEALWYSLRARRWLGSFSVLVTIDPS